MHNAGLMASVINDASHIQLVQESLEQTPGTPHYRLLIVANDTNVNVWPFVGEQCITYFGCVVMNSSQHKRFKCRAFRGLQCAGALIVIHKESARSLGVSHFCRPLHIQSRF